MPLIKSRKISQPYHKPCHCQLYQGDPAGNYMYKDNNRNTRKRCEICSINPSMHNINGQTHFKNFVYCILQDACVTVVE